MNRDPFLRLALIAACGLYVLGLFAVGWYLNFGAALAVIVGGVAGAYALTYEPSPKKPETDRRRRQRQPAEGTRGFERLE